MDIPEQDGKFEIACRAITTDGHATWIELLDGTTRTLAENERAFLWIGENE